MNEFIVTVNDKKKKIDIITENEALIDGHKVNYELIILNNLTKLLRIEDVFYEISSDKIEDGKYSLFINGDNITSVVRTELQERAAQLLDKAQVSSNRKINVKSPMPGMILKLKKIPGDVVSAGDSILILEAMKMENDVKAPAGGKITEVIVKEGIAVDKGDILFTIE